MRWVGNLGFLFPAWAMPWLILATIAAGVLKLPGRIVFGLAAIPVFRLLLAPFLDAWLATQPLWVQGLVLVTVALLTIQSILALIFGAEAAAHVTGVMLVRIFDALMLGPFRGTAILLRFVLRHRG
jgi:hypothetical protein